MAITLNDLTVNFSHLDRESLLSEWRWLIGPSKQPILLAAIGDAYLQDPEDGTIHLLDVGGGGVDQIADSVEEFQGLLKDREFVTDSFVPSTIVALRNEGKVLGPGQIYSYIKPPVLGGSYSTSNLEPTDIGVHYGILGQIHRQVKDLPDGASVESITLE